MILICMYSGVIWKLFEVHGYLAQYSLSNPYYGEIEMALSAERRKSSKTSLSDGDTGSEVQVALTANINDLQSHFKSTFMIITLAAD